MYDVVSFRGKLSLQSPNLVYGTIAVKSFNKRTYFTVFEFEFLAMMIYSPDYAVTLTWWLGTAGHG